MALGGSTTFDARSRGGKDRTKAMFTVHERPGQTWIWVPEATHAFLPATIIEVSKVSGAHTASSHV